MEQKKTLIFLTHSINAQSDYRISQQTTKKKFQTGPILFELKKTTVHRYSHNHTIKEYNPKSLIAGKQQIMRRYKILCETFGMLKTHNYKYTLSSNYKTLQEPHRAMQQSKYQQA